MTSDEAVGLLCSLVQIPSVSGEEDAVVRFLAAQIADLPVEIVIEDRNLTARFGQGRPELWLNSHLDTVRAAEGYTFDPWGGEVIEGEIRGLGANDAKGSVVALTAAFSRFVRRHPNFSSGSLVLAATCEEEIGGEGLKRLMRDRSRPDAIIVGEPNEMTVANCCKGVVLASIVVQGKSAHVSRPWQGVNAVRVAAPLIADLVADHGLAIDPLLGPATHEITRIEGGHQSNALPGSVRIGLDCRTTPSFNNAAMVAHLAALVKQHSEATLTITHSDVKPVRTSDDGRLVKTALETRSQSAPAPFVGVCDFVYCDQTDAIIMGPGKGERSHRADEFLKVDELSVGIDGYLQTIEAYFGL